MAQRDTRVQRSVFLASLLASAALSVALVTRDASGYTIALAVLGGIAVLGLFAPPRLAGLLLAVGVLNALTVLPELALRAAGFERVSGVQFGYPDAVEFQRFVPDRELFWTWPPGAPEVNSLGFRAHEPRVPKPPGVTRLMFLGDSCSEQGFPEAWPDIAVYLLGREGIQADGVNLSVSGYSSHQGRILARKYGEPMEPDVVFVYYGWNDHWLAYGTTDARKLRDPRTHHFSVDPLFAHSRLLQALRSATSGPATPLSETRVPVSAYEENLRAIVAHFGALGVPVVLVTAPSAHERVGVPSYLVEKRFASDPDSVLRLHRQYNQVAREVAAQPGAHLLDLAATLEQEADPRATFVTDGIHLTDGGRWEVARRAVELLRSQGLVP